MLRMIVEGIGFDHLQKPLVVLKDWDGRKLLPIWVDATQAKSIAWELDGISAPRPSSHDLLLQCIRLARGQITRVVINDLQNSTFYATLDIDTPRGLLHVDARPSDALALAVRAKCPVFVDGAALEALIDVEETPLTLSASDGDEEAIDDPHSFVEEDPIASQQPSLPTVWNAETAAAPPPQDEINRFRRLLGDLNDD